MNDDLISRQAAIDGLLSAIDVLGALDEADIRACVELMPSAQPSVTLLIETLEREHKKLMEMQEDAKRMRGRWIPHKSTGYLMCDHCKDVYIDEEWLGDGKWNFCPNCGAEMEGGEDGGEL